MRVLCVLGRHNYGDPGRGLGTEYAAFLPALQRLGHEVAHFESWNRSCYANYSELNRDLLATVERVRPNVILAVQMHYEIWIETLQILRARGDVATICWTTDDTWKYVQVSRFLGRVYHAMTTTYADFVPRYHADGIAQVLLTQWAARSESLAAPLPAASCRYAVSFAGSAHGNRRQQIAALQSCGITVECFGHGWPNGPVSDVELSDIMRNSMVSLNFANAASGPPQVKARTFEVPGAGGFLLTQYAAGLERYYELGNEVVTFDGTENCARLIKYYLSHPAERDGVAQAGHERTRNDHTYDKRMQEVVDFAIRAQDAWQRGHPAPVTVSFERAANDYRPSPLLRVLRAWLVQACSIVWGRRRGLRAARRLAFECCWRLGGLATFRASGWPGRMFPEL